MVRISKRKLNRIEWICYKTRNYDLNFQKELRKLSTKELEQPWILPSGEVVL
jgi:hypothetical protein